jgi:signal transduction histidine kinase
MFLPFFKKKAQTSPQDQQMLELQSQLQAQKNLQFIKDQQIYNLQIFLSLIDEGLIILDGEFKVIFTSQKVIDTLGLSFEKIVNQKLDTVVKIYDKDTELTTNHLCPVEKDLIEAQIYNKKDLKIVGKKEVIVELSTKQFRNKEGNIFFAIIIKDYNKESELENMKLDFVSMAAHELRTPLTSINSYMAVFLSENKDKLNDDQKQLLNSVVNATQQLRILVEDLLNISKIEKGVMNINYETVDYISIISDTIQYFKQRSIEKNIQFKFENNTSIIPHVRVDKVRISEVLTNLLTNAIKYTDSGGSIKVWLETKDNQLITHVTDTGKGVSPELLPNLFKKFYRAVTPLDQSIKGTGLGLYISKSIVEMHHGRIWAESNVGKGSTFSFSIPL